MILFGFKIEDADWNDELVVLFLMTLSRILIEGTLLLDLIKGFDRLINFNYRVIIANSSQCYRITLITSKEIYIYNIS